MNSTPSTPPSESLDSKTASVEDRSANEESSSDKQKPAPRSRRLLTDYYGSVVLLLIATLIGAGYFVIKPKLDAYKMLNANIEGLKQRLVQEQGYLEALNRSVAAAQTIAPDVLQKVESALPRVFTIADMLVLLERKAAAYRVELQGVSFVFPTETQNRSTGSSVRSIKPQTVKLNLKMRAQDYFSVKNFLESLELSLRILDVETLSVSEFKEDGTSFSVQIRTYYFPSEVDSTGSSN